MYLMLTVHDKSMRSHSADLILCMLRTQDPPKYWLILQHCLRLRPCLFSSVSGPIRKKSWSFSKVSFPFGNRGILKQLSTLPALKTRRQDDWISIHCTLLSLNDLIYLRFQHLLISMHVHPISNGHNGFSEKMLHVLKEDLNEMLKTAICSVPLSQRQ